LHGAITGSAHLESRTQDVLEKLSMKKMTKLFAAAAVTSLIALTGCPRKTTEDKKTDPVTKVTDEKKPADVKADEPKTEAKPEAKPDEAKPTEAKPDEAKPTEAKPTEAKPDEAKPTETKTEEKK
jgi:hypothetical protein